MRSLWPREHGAYAQLLAPLATALVLRVPAASSILLAFGACFAFLANEPLLVMLGHRGKRLREAQGIEAKRRLAVLGALAIAVGAVGLALAPTEARLVAAAVAAPAVVMVALAWTRSEHSLVGEIVAALTLPGAAAPVAVASGVVWSQAIWLWAAWAIGYAASVVAVHRVIGRHRRPRSRADAIAGLIAVAALVASLALQPLRVAAPLCIAAIALIAYPPHASHLRTIGVALVVASIAGGAIALL